MCSRASQLSGDSKTKTHILFDMWARCPGISLNILAGQSVIVFKSHAAKAQSS